MKRSVLPVLALSVIAPQALAAANCAHSQSWQCQHKPQDTTTVTNPVVIPSGNVNPPTQTITPVGGIDSNHHNVMIVPPDPPKPQVPTPQPMAVPNPILPPQKVPGLVPPDPPAQQTPPLPKPMAVPNPILPPQKVPGLVPPDPPKPQVPTPQPMAVPNPILPPQKVPGLVPPDPPAQQTPPLPKPMAVPNPILPPQKVPGLVPPDPPKPQVPTPQPMAVPNPILPPQQTPVLKPILHPQPGNTGNWTSVPPLMVTGGPANAGGGGNGRPPHQIVVHRPPQEKPVSSGSVADQHNYTLEFIEPGIQNHRVEVYRSKDAREQVYRDVIPLDAGGFHLTVIGIRNPDYSH